MFMNSHNKFYRYISICAIVLLLLGRIIRKVFDIDLMPKYVKLFLIIIALMFGAIYWYKKDKNITE